MDIDRHAAARLRISVLCCRRVELDVVWSNTGWSVINVIQ